LKAYVCWVCELRNFSGAVAANERKEFNSSRKREMLKECGRWGVVSVEDRKFWARRLEGDTLVQSTRVIKIFRNKLDLTRGRVKPGLSLRRLYPVDFQRGRSVYMTWLGFLPDFTAQSMYTCVARYCHQMMRMLPVRPSVRVLVPLLDCDHIHWELRYR